MLPFVIRGKGDGAVLITLLLFLDCYRMDIIEGGGEFGCQRKGFG